MSEYIYTSNGEPLANERGEILLARAGEIVRCRDCKHRAGANVQAAVSDLCMWLDIIVKPDGFCAWGEKAINE